MANILASLVVKIGADLTGVTAGMNVFEQRTRKLKASFSSVAVGTATIATAAVAAGAALVAIAVKTGEYADRLLDLKDQTGLTTTELQRFRAVAMQAGVGADTIAEAVIKLQTRMASGAEGSADMRAALSQLGIQTTDFNGRSRAMGEIMTEAIGKLGDMEDVTQRNVMAVKLFGRGATELLPVLGLTSAEMATAIDRAEKLGIIMSEDALEAADKFRKEQELLTAALAAGGREIASAVIPMLIDFAKNINDNVLPAVIDWAREWARLLGIGKGVSQSAQAAIDSFAGIDDTRVVIARLNEYLALVPTSAVLAGQAAREFQLKLDAFGITAADVDPIIEALQQRLRDLNTVTREAATAVVTIIPPLGSAGKRVFDLQLSLVPLHESFDRVRTSVYNLMPAVIAAKAITHEFRTPVEVLTDRLAELDRVAHLMTPETYMAAATSARAAFASATVEVEKLDEGQQMMVSALSSGFADAAVAGKNFAASMHAMAKGIIRDLIRVAIQGALMREFLGGATGGVGFLGGLFSKGVGFLGGLFGGGGVPGRASGGPVSAGSPYMVGERGPELFVPRSSGSIVPNGQGGGGASASAIVDLAFRRMPAPPTASSPQEMARDRYWRQFGAELVTALKHDGVRFA